MDESTKGTISAITAFFLWGGFPIYWKALQHVSSTQILAHRVVWSLVFVLVLLSIQRRWNEVKSVISFYPNVSIFLVTSFLLGGNWLIYIWAVNSNQIVEASLGYFINPLVNICLGVVFLRERLYRWQFISVAIAFVGVLFLTLQYGRLPWIAFSLALAFGTYGLLRKTAKAGSMVGLLFDTGFLAPISLFYLLFLAVHGSGALVSINLETDVLLIGCLLYTSPSPRDQRGSRMPSSA